MSEAAFRAEGEFPLPATLLGLSDSEFRARFRGSPITRTKRAGLARNAALTLGGREDPDAGRALETARDDREPAVRRAAERMLARLRRS
jgi:epoxyqueuosine reductase